MHLARYRKAIVAVIGALAVMGAELPDTAPSWLTGVCAVASAIAVYFIPNDRPPTTRVELAERVERIHRPPGPMDGGSVV